MRTTKIITSLFVAVIGIVIYSAPVNAVTTAISPYSWDPGLYATKGQFNDTAHSWGRRATSGAWGTGAVNYQSGSTTNYRGSSSGKLDVVLKGSYCPSACTYGSGSGYKGLVQLWNDPNNFIAFGLIKDPGVSPNSPTLMIEGSANGKPVGGYWPANAITGTSHLFTVEWGPQGISVSVDHNVTLGPYPVAASNPSISLLGAARNTGDIADTTFEGINFSQGSVVADPIYVPQGTPYVTYDARLTENGSGTGYSSYVNVHDANNNALSLGIQSDTGAPESRGAPYYVWERVQNGQFTYQYLSPASNNPTDVTLKWWKSEDVAVYYVSGTPIASIHTHLDPRLFFSAEGNARKNGDTLNSKVENVQISAGDQCPQYCGLSGTWNTTDFNFYGLRATRTNSTTQNGANFSLTGTVSGLPANGDWDSYLVAGIGMIAQNWNGQ
ncbi:MAG: hypothetical protein ABIQ04_04300 [Candidatus Saccharimonadales bacterium]